MPGLSTVLRSTLLASLLGVAGADAARAYGGIPYTPDRLLSTWGLDPGVLLGLAFSGFLYASGVGRLWRRAGKGTGIRRWEAGCFAAGWFFLAFALVSPLHPLGNVLFSAHMVQHVILMLVAAPLLVLGRPLIPWFRALPVHWARTAGGWAKRPHGRSFWRSISNPFVAWSIHGLALWIWHIPALFQATRSSDLAHTAQHLSFFGSALLFWWVIVHGRRARPNYGVAVLCLFTTALHNGVLGMLLMYARTVWYPGYELTAPLWGLTALEDQQLAGFIMWFPAGLVYLAAGCTLVALWIRESERSMLKREAAVHAHPGGPYASHA